ncbi:MAG: caspase family protein [Brevinematales bacterium]|nr:caspase family protein [Brevinematales bacterium]
MKRTGLLLLFLLLVVPSFSNLFAVTLKTLIILEDKYNYKKLNDIAQGVRVNYKHIEKLLRILEDNHIVDVDETVISGKDATKKNILKTIGDMKVDRDELFLVYFAGHGGMKKGKTFFSTAEGGMIYRKDFEEIVKEKPAKLKILITDACSASIEELAHKGLLDSVAPKESEVNPEVYRNLFLNYTGFLHISAASEGEFAWVSPAKGGFFSYALFYMTLYRNPSDTWEEVIVKAKSFTQKSYKKMYNSGKIPKKILKEIKQLGIKGQTPKVYSMPVMVNNGEKTIPLKSEGKVVKLINSTQKTVTYYLITANKKSDKYVLKPGEMQTLEDPWPMEISIYDPVAKSTYLVFNNGTYYFFIDRNDDLVLQSDDQQAIR